MKINVYNGCDLLTTNEGKRLLSDKKLGLITNNSARTKNNDTVSYAMSSLYDLHALFSAEHGLDLSMQAGEADNEVFIDKETNLHVYSLYGDKSVLEKADAIFKNLDALVFDMQDIGTRYYTYQYALLDSLILCKKNDKPLIVLDRINPLGCERVEGSSLDANTISEVGRVPSQPIVSGMTIGELALWFNKKMNINANIKILKCKNLTRNITFEDTDLIFIPPSPNLKSLNALFLYAGTCLFEGTNISEGRGTDSPFEIFGAPWLDPEAVIKALDNYPDEIKQYWNGLDFIPTKFTPTFSDYENQECNGIQLKIKNKSAVKPFETCLYIIEVLYYLHKNDFQKNTHLANLSGSKNIMSKTFKTTDFLKSQEDKLNCFVTERKNFLIYD